MNANGGAARKAEYTVVEGLGVTLQVARKALDDVRTLSAQVRDLETRLACLEANQAQSSGRGSASSGSGRLDS